VTSGPFKNSMPKTTVETVQELIATMNVNLGPVLLPLINGTILFKGEGFAHNPRCLKGDLTNAINRQYANASAISSTIIAHDNIANFQLTMQSVPGSENIGVHGGGHYSLGGDPGHDFYISPGDPVLYLHHAQIDCV